MGWSCTADAMRTYESWSKRCLQQSGTQNSYCVDGVHYFFETGREQADGAITGSVYNLETGRNVGRFRIDPDGHVERYPKGLRSLL